MSTNGLTPLRKAIIAEKVRNPDAKSAAIADNVRALGFDCSDRWVRAVVSGIEKYKPQSAEPENDGYTVEEDLSDSGGRVRITPANDIETLEDAVIAANVDLTVWRVTGWKKKTYSTPMKLTDYKMVDKKIVERNDRPHKIINHYIELILKPREDVAMVQAIQNIIRDRLPRHKPRTFELGPEPDGDFCMTMDLFDAHFGMLAWGKETGLFDHDIKVAEDRLPAVVEALLNQACRGQRISKIFWPVGNDYLHVNNPESITPRGKHGLDVDTRYVKIYEHGKMALIRSIDLALSVAPVELLWVPGNHDPETSYHLVDFMDGWYRDSKWLTVNKAPTKRKGVRWGDCFIAFAHGDGAKETPQSMPNLMISEWPKQMADCRYKEAHIGHKHKKAELRTLPLQIIASIIVRRCACLCDIDSYHYREGYLDAIAMGQANVYAKEGRGNIAQYNEYVH